MANDFEEIVRQKGREQPELPYTHCAGLILSDWAHTPKRICETAGAALEDANQHVFAWLMFEAGKGTLPQSLLKAIQSAFDRSIKKGL